MSLQADEVVAFLKAQPDFLEHHPGVLQHISLPVQHAGKAVSLHERQMQVLRDKLKAVEQKVVEMGRAAAENHAIVQKMQVWHRDLLKEKELDRLPRLVTQGLGQLFSIPHVTLLLWSQLNTTIDPQFILTPADEQKSWIDQSKTVYCGPTHNLKLEPWLGADHAVRSIVIIPLRVGVSPDTFGVLMLGSPDAGRYTADMGQDFLVSIQESASACLSRLLL